MIATLTAILLFSWAFLAAICALYTAFAFRFLDIDPLALDVVQGRLGLLELAQVRRFDLIFSQNEIQHFLDVAQAVSMARGGLGLTLAGLVVITLARPDLRKPATTRALGIFAAALGLIIAGYVGVGYSALSDFLHGFVFEPGSHVFSMSSLTARIYSNQDMINGAVFVIALTALALAISWLTARIALPWPVALTSSRTRQSQSDAS